MPQGQYRSEFYHHDDVTTHNLLLLADYCHLIAQADILVNSLQLKTRFFP